MMKHVTTFTIVGNHKNFHGNPLPKARLTSRQRWTDKAQQYAYWKMHVQKAFLDSLVTQTVKGAGYEVSYQHPTGKPIHLSKIATNGGRKIEEMWAFMSVRIAWADGHHGDPENIFGSIADALFENDKNLFAFILPATNPEQPDGSVKVAIWIAPESELKEFANTVTSA